MKETTDHTDDTDTGRALAFIGLKLLNLRKKPLNSANSNFKVALNGGSGA
jgi:hypothetical protein